MCQLFALSSSTPIQVGFDWRRFVFQGAMVNPDGWGVAFQSGREFHLVREPHTAEDSPCVRFFAAHGPASRLVVSHVRRATLGEQTLANTQPLVRKMGGRCHLFAHNGHVPPEPVADSAWLKPVGETDSELIFLDLLARLEPLWRDEVPDLEARSAVVEAFAADMRARGAANFLYSDGITLFAHGHRRTVPGEAITDDPGLYLQRQDTALTEFSDFCDGLKCRGKAGVAMVATLPLGKGLWRPLGEGELVRIENGTVL